MHVTFIFWWVYIKLELIIVSLVIYLLICNLIHTPLYVTLYKWMGKHAVEKCCKYTEMNKTPHFFVFTLFRLFLSQNNHQ